MGKYEKQNIRKKNTRKKDNTFRFTALIGIGLILICGIFIWRIAEEEKIPVLAQTQTTNPEETTQEVTAPEISFDESIDLGNGLTITAMADYAGIYMEDGSDEIVSNVMMILLKNNAEQDLQLARIDVVYGDFTAEFEVTNLPAGETVVALERNRASMPAQEHETVSVRNVTFFPEAMTLMDNRLEITGGNGYLDVKNVSGENIVGVLYIYYKNSAPDLLYGGITYRAKIESGIGAGETIRVLTGHYMEGSSRIVHVVGGE